MALFDNPYNMKEYMDDIESYTLLSGNIREVGAKAEIIASEKIRDSNKSNRIGKQ